MSQLSASRSDRALEVAVIEATLNSLRDDHQMISGWKRTRTRWYVVAGATWGPYGLREIRGFIDGCRAMGAGV